MRQLSAAATATDTVARVEAAAPQQTKPVLREQQSCNDLRDACTLVRELLADGARDDFLLLHLTEVLLVLRLYCRSSLDVVPALSSAAP